MRTHCVRLTRGNRNHPWYYILYLFWPIDGYQQVFTDNQIYPLFHVYFTLCMSLAQPLVGSIPIFSSELLPVYSKL